MLNFTRMKIRSKIILVVKLILSSVLLYWLIKRHSFNVENIKLGLSNGRLFIIFLVFTFIQLILSALRTHLLLQLNEFKLPEFASTLKISWASTFISGIAPSSVFGDFFRIKELMKIENGLNKDNSFYSSMIAKIFSTLGLVTISLVASSSLLGKNEKMSTVFYFSFAIFSFSIFVLYQSEKIITLLVQYLNSFYKLSSNQFILNRITNFKSYFLNLSRDKKLISYSFLLSLLIQIMNTISFVLIINFLNPTASTNIILLLCVVPIGIFVMTLPISFSGLGVGHLAFATLLKIFNIQNGADVFTVYFALSFIFNFLGIAPFIWIMKQNFSKPLPTNN